MNLFIPDVPPRFRHSVRALALSADYLAQLVAAIFDGADPMQVLECPDRLLALLAAAKTVQAWKRHFLRRRRRRRSAAPGKHGLRMQRAAVNPPDKVLSKA